MHAPGSNNGWSNPGWSNPGQNGNFACPDGYGSQGNYRRGGYHPGANTYGRQYNTYFPMPTQGGSGYGDQMAQAMNYDQYIQAMSARAQATQFSQQNYFPPRSQQPEIVYNPSQGAQGSDWYNYSGTQQPSMQPGTDWYDYSG
jgi:hypothetical protein